MARTTTREIVRVCADLARMDRKAKIEVLVYLQGELAVTAPEPDTTEPATYREGEQ